MRFSHGSSPAPRARSAPGIPRGRSKPARCRRRPCAYPSTAGDYRTRCGPRPGTRSLRTRVPPAHTNGSPVPCEPVQDVSDVGGSLGDDLQSLMQVAAGSGLRDPGVAGQGAHVDAVLEPPQYQDGLAPNRGDPLVGADVVGAAVDGRSAADDTYGSSRDVESGMVEYPRRASLASRFPWSKTTRTHGSACTPLRQTPP